MYATPCLALCPLGPYWLFVALGGATRASDSVCVLSRGQYLGTGSCGRGTFGLIMSCCVMWSCEAVRWGDRGALCTALPRRGGLTEPGWEAPQDKHTSVCLSAASSVSLPSSNHISIYLTFLSRAVISTIVTAVYF